MASRPNPADFCLSTDKNVFYIFYINGEQNKKKRIFVICKYKKFKFKCPQTLGCHSKSNCSANFCVYSQFLSYLVALLPALHGELCFMAPCLVWLHSSPWSKEAAVQGSAHLEGEKPGDHALGSLDSGVATG